MTELMKRYEKKTGHNAFLTYGITQAICYPTYVEWLEYQLTWRSVSEKPEKCGQISLKRIENGVDSNELTWFYFLESLDEFDIVVNTLDATHWFPIPPAPEGEPS